MKSDNKIEADCSIFPCFVYLSPQSDVYIILDSKLAHSDAYIPAFSCFTLQRFYQYDVTESVTKGD